MMLFEIYLRNKKQKLPFWITLAIISILSFGIFYFKTYKLPLSIFALMLVYFMTFYKKHYIPVLKFFIMFAVVISLLTFDINIMFSMFCRALGYSHLTLLFIVLCPPASFKNQAIKLCLVFLPYFENHIKHIAEASRLKGIKIKTRNPVMFVYNGARLLIPILVIFVSTMEEVIMALKIKGY